MADKQTLVYGIFKEELKNRFLCTVNINGIDLTCYIPSSCRLSNFVDLTGRTVILVETTTPKARTKYAVFAFEYKNSYILTNLSLANKIIEYNIKNRRFSFLGKRKLVSRETVVGKYKADLFIEDTKTLIEIKSLLSFERKAVFPSVYSERAINQLVEISKLLDNGYKACYIFVSLNPFVKKIKINSSIRKYYKLFLQCREKGMSVFGVSVKLINGKPVVCARIQILD